ncbi:MAG: 2Fe-2S iron-sulfur cluster-binding protein [Acidimicrobiales bacterium]|nr:2Fe-2S iron-sulfur cluster-binding protein [Acidimicrobiales bacterium]
MPPAHAAAVRASVEPLRELILRFVVDGQPVEVPYAAGSLLEVLREHLRVTAPKDGCSPQGQCGCCTVLVDGQPRVACVTPARRVAGRDIRTVDGLESEVRESWASAFTNSGASQCGFCTPGIICRLEGLRRRDGEQVLGDPVVVGRALQAHLCRCTGWRTILEAAAAFGRGDLDGLRPLAVRDLTAAARRAEIEGGTPQKVGPDVALGRAGFADDMAPPGALVVVPDGRGGWAAGETLQQARVAAGKVPGRRTSVAGWPPIDLPDGDWARVLRTSWVEPAYLETDASWCEPGGEPASPLANGGAFGGKLDSIVTEVARDFADRLGRAVRVVLSREDVVRLGPKRPPMAAGLQPDGTGVVRVARTPGITEVIAQVAPKVRVEEVTIPGPPTSSRIRAAGWAELAVLLASFTDRPGHIVAPNGAEAEAIVRSDSTIAVSVRCGDPLDEVVLRSYCIGAAHMALSWVTSEQLAVDADGLVHDLTIRSFGVLRAVDTPAIEVHIESSDAEPINGSDAVFAAVAGAVWAYQGFPASWPTGRSLSA